MKIVKMFAIRVNAPHAQLSCSQSAGNPGIRVKYHHCCHLHCLQHNTRAVSDTPPHLAPIPLELSIRIARDRSGRRKVRHRPIVHFHLLARARGCRQRTQRHFRVVRREFRHEISVFDDRRIVRVVGFKVRAARGRRSRNGAGLESAQRSRVRAQFDERFRAPSRGGFSARFLAVGGARYFPVQRRRSETSGVVLDDHNRG